LTTMNILIFLTWPNVKVTLQSGKFNMLFMFQYMKLI
jgi:hypothetical protein